MYYYGRLPGRTKLSIVVSAARQAGIPFEYRRIVVKNKRRYDLYLANQVDAQRLQILTPGIECARVVV